MIDINTLTTEQAKALAFDELVKIETAQKNLQVLNQLIQQKSQPTVSVGEPKIIEPIKKPKKV